MHDCLICDRHASHGSALIRAGEHALLVHYPCSEDTPAVYRGHLFVEPKRHVTSFGQLEPDEAAEVGQLMALGSRLLTQELGAEHIYVFSIQHLVEHVHIHVVPRYAGTPEEFWGGPNLARWPAAPMLHAGPLEELRTRLVAQAAV